MKFSFSSNLSYLYPYIIYHIWPKADYQELNSSSSTNTHLNQISETHLYIQKITTKRTRVCYLNCFSLNLLFQTDEDVDPIRS